MCVNVSTRQPVVREPRGDSSVRASLIGVILWVGLVWAMEAGGSEPTALGQLAASMKAGTWSELTTQGYGNHLLSAQHSDILDYADVAVWDPGSQQVLFLGQGHYAALRFITYSAADNSWREMPTPPWWKGDPRTGEGAIGHAYDNNAIDPVRGIFYFHQSATPLVYRYLITRQEWSTLPGIPGAQLLHGTALVYHPDMKGLLRVVGGTVHFYSDAKNSWSVLADRLPMGRIHNIATYNAARRVAIIGGGNDSRDLYEIDARGKITRLPDAPCVVRVSSTVVSVDPVSGDVLVLNKEGGKKFFGLDMQRREWRILAEPPISEGAAASIGGYGVSLFFSAHPSKVYLYKHTTSPAP